MKNSLGFGLIELLVVVAICGILAQITISNYQTNQRRSMQAEAKISLGAIYSLEKSFYSEYSAYVPSFDAIGYTREGFRFYYRIGWPGAAIQYLGTITGYSGSVNNNVYIEQNSPYSPFCGLSGAPMNQGTAQQAPFDVDNPQTFTVGACGRLQPTSDLLSVDQWQINHLKVLMNHQSGI